MRTSAHGRTACSHGPAEAPVSAIQAGYLVAGVEIDRAAGIHALSRSAGALAEGAAVRLTVRAHRAILATEA
jgi:hypothetical protein